jgi:hypothetical protein
MSSKFFLNRNAFRNPLHIEQWMPTKATAQVRWADSSRSQESNPSSQRHELKAVLDINLCRDGRLDLFRPNDRMRANGC